MAPKKAAATKAAPKAAAKKGSSSADKSSAAVTHASAPVKDVSEKLETNGMFHTPNSRWNHISVMNDDT